MTAPLIIYTVYENPADYPGLFVVRRFDIINKPLAKEVLGTAETLEKVRAFIPPGLVRIDRLPMDERTVVETWL